MYIPRSRHPRQNRSRWIWINRQELNDIETLQELLKSNQKLEEFAQKFGIYDIYQDNNIKQLQQAVYLGLRFIADRDTIDAVDANGNMWELKSTNIATGNQAFSTSHNLTASIIERYRKCCWAFSVYDNTALIAIYALHPTQLEPYFDSWMKKLSSGEILNNPKIRLKFVKTHGICMLRKR